jgi:hypothetical protein
MHLFCTCSALALSPLSRSLHSSPSPNMDQTSSAMAGPLAACAADRRHMAETAYVTSGDGCSWMGDSRSRQDGPWQRSNSVHVHVHGRLAFASGLVSALCSGPPSDMTCRNSSMGTLLSCLALSCPVLPRRALPCPVPTTRPVGSLALHDTGVLLLRPLTWQGSTATRYDRGRPAQLHFHHHRPRPHHACTLLASCSQNTFILDQSQPVASKTPSSLLVPMQVSRFRFHKTRHVFPLHPTLHHQCCRHCNNKPKVRGRWLQQRRRQRLGPTTALAVIRHVVRLRCHLKHGPIRRALVVKVDKKEVGRSVPRC